MKFRCDGWIGKELPRWGRIGSGSYIPLDVISRFWIFFYVDQSYVLHAVSHAEDNEDHFKEDPAGHDREKECQGREDKECKNSEEC